MKIVVTCPKCGNVDEYGNRCDRCDGVLDWAMGNIKATNKGLECLDCGHIIWSVECESCGHSIPVIGKLVSFDDSDDPALVRILTRILRLFFAPPRPS